MTPQDLAKSGSEDAEQTALFSWVRDRINEDSDYWGCLEWMFAIPNGGSRGGDKKSAMIVGGKLKATGVKAGVSDIFIPVPAHNLCGLFIEMKKSKLNGGGTVSPKQQEFGNWVQQMGYGFCVCYGWEEAAAVITQWLSPP